MTRRAAVLSLARGKSNGVADGTMLSIGFVGASPHAQVAAQSPLAGRVNYLIGRNRARWHTGIPTYARVRYQRLWPGIDAAFYGNQGRLEYDFDLAPGADPRKVGLSFAGARSLREDRGGALLIGLHGGGVRELRPRAYQLVGGIRRPVRSRYVLRGDRVGVRLGAYHHRLPLVIDPALIYSTYLGGSGFDQANGIAVDSSGAAYITGSTASANFPIKNPYQGSKKSTAGADAFVTKLDPSGSALAYSTYLGGTTTQAARGIAVDSSGAAYVTGGTSSTNFPTKNAYQGTKKGASDGFVTKLDPSGSALAYSTYLGGTNDDFANAIAVDPLGAAYITGSTNSTDFPTKSAFQTGGAGGTRAIVAKFDSSGGLAYSTYLGGTGAGTIDVGNGIAVDSSRDAYVTGSTTSTDFPHPNAYQSTNAGGNDAFVTKFDPSGSNVYYSTYLGGSSDDEGKAIAVDSSGAAYVGGDTLSTNFPTKNGYQSAPGGGGQDAFVTKVDPLGSTLSYSTYLGGTNPDAAFGIAVDSSGAAYVTGFTSSLDFPTQNAYQPVSGGGQDAFVTKFAPAGATLSYSTYLGGSSTDNGNGIAIDSSGAAYVAGITLSTDFPTKNAYQGTNAGGGGDAFVAKLSGRPLASTQPATNITQTSATLHGTVNPGGDATSFMFQYGKTAAYGSQTATQGAGSDSANHAVSASIAGLAPGTAYHFRIVATNSAGTSYGGDRVFSTAPRFVLGPPSVSKRGVTVSVSCQAAPGTACKGLAQLTTLERLLGKQIVALSASKKHKKRVKIGSKRFTLAAGAKRKIVVPLNRKGRQLLKRFGHIPATLKISLLNTNPPTVITTKTTIKPKKKKKKKH